MSVEGGPFSAFFSYQGSATKRIRGSAKVRGPDWNSSILGHVRGPNICGNSIWAIIEAIEGMNIYRESCQHMIKMQLFLALWKW